MPRLSKNVIKVMFITFEGGIAVAAQGISPISIHFFIAWSVCQSHLCPLLRPFDGIKCHLADTRDWSSDTMLRAGP